MLTELQTLQGLIKELGAKHHAAKQALENLKAKPMVNASELDALKAQQTQQKTAFDELKSAHTDLTHEFNKVTEQLAEKTAQCELLEIKVDSLEADKDELLAKNEISSQRAQTILERLSALDKG